jgi:hypothetical protein
MMYMHAASTYYRGFGCLCKVREADLITNVWGFNVHTGQYCTVLLRALSEILR